MTLPPPAHPGESQLIVPARGRRKGWLQRRRSTQRGRFELVIIGGGVIALALAATLPGMADSTALRVLAAAGVLMTALASISGFVPAMTAAAFSPLVVALTDPMWTLGSTIDDFTLARECAATFAVFTLAAILGTGIRQLRHKRRRRQNRTAWRNRDNFVTEETSAPLA